MHLLHSALSNLVAESFAKRFDEFDATIIAQYSNYNDNDDYYNEEQPSKIGYNTNGRRRAYKPSKVVDKSGMNMFQNQKQVGAALLGFGLLFTVMGMMLFFEGNLLRLGNICIIAGVPLLIGPNRVRQFFSKASRLQATIVTSFGILLVFWGKPRLALGRRFPVIGNIIEGIEGALGRDDKSNKKTKNRREDREPYPPPRRREQKRYSPDF